MAAVRVIRNQSAALDVVFYPSGSETPTDPDGNTATVTITRADGTVLVAGAATTRTGAGRYRYTLAAQANLDQLTVAWTGLFGTLSVTSTTYAEIVGGVVADLADIRVENPNLADVTRFTTAELVAARSWFEDLAEDFCRTAFVPKYRRDILSGEGAAALLLTRIRPIRLLAAAVDGTAVTAPTLATWTVQPEGTVTLPESGTFTSFPAGESNVVVAYEHGYPTVPWDVRRAALTAIRWRLLTDDSNQIPDRAMSMTNEFGNISFAQPGMHRAVGLPEVDAVLNRYCDRHPAVG